MYTRTVFIANLENIMLYVLCSNLMLLISVIHYKISSITISYSSPKNNWNYLNKTKYSQKLLNVYLPVLRDLLTEESCVGLLQGFRHNDFSLDSQDESLQRFVDDGQQVVEPVHFLSQNRHQGWVTYHCIYCFLYNWNRNLKILNLLLSI